MNVLTDIQQEYKKVGTEFGKTDIELQALLAERYRKDIAEREELKGLNGQARAERKKYYDSERKRLNEEIKRAAGSKKDIKNEFNSKVEDFFNRLDPTDKIKELNDSFPFLMFPLRLETRFKTTGSQKQLWLRVYPDDCNINSKEELLSSSEYNNARSFWIEIWKAAGIEAEERGAWRSLVNSHGSGRAAWIIQQYKPLAVKPVKPDDSFKILVVLSSLVLTAAEKVAAKTYWTSVWLGNHNPSVEEAAFDALKSAINDARATIIKQNYIPSNLSDTVPAGLSASKVLLEKLELPDYAPKESSWTQAAKTMALPDKFVAITDNGIKKTPFLFSKPVKDGLAVSMDPSLEGDDQIKKNDKNELVLNEDVAWMADFENAIDAGMAIKINLSSEEASRGFEKLFVVGIRFKTDKDGAKTELEALINNHFYSSSGFGLLKQGTATNNTEEGASGYSWIDNPDESYERIFRNRENFSLTNELDKKSDGQKLADYLGIDPGILKIMPNANGKDQLEAFAMNTALFPATIGYFMEEMMDPVFSQSDIEATRVFFAGFVSGRGPIPAIRIGKQPYGVLPVAAYSKMNFSGPIDTTKQQPYPERLRRVLNKMDRVWETKMNEVSFVGKSGDAHQILIDVLSLHPNSVEFHQRYLESLQDFYNQINIAGGGRNSSATAEIITGVRATAKDILLRLGVDIKDKNIPVFEKLLLHGENLLNGFLVDDQDPSEINPVRPYAGPLNYIQWLSSSAPEILRTENFGGNTPPNTLLYLMLRHALLLALADAAAAILVSKGVIANKKVYHDPPFINVQKNGSGKSKFEHLYSSYPEFTGEEKLADYIYNPAVLSAEEETKKLNETINALRVLENTSTAALERLLIEHVDCCNYRLDAWKTGLINYSLTKQRTLNTRDDSFSKGIYLGAYGWLLDVRPGNHVRSNVNLNPELSQIFNYENNTPLQTDSANLGYIHAPSLHHAATAAILRNAYDSNRSEGSDNSFAIDLSSNRVRIAAAVLEGMRNGQSLAALLGYQFERGLHDKYSLEQEEVDMFIYPLRQKFPLVANNGNDTNEPAASIETIEANNVIDGLKLIDYVRTATRKTYPFDFLLLPAIGGLPVASVTQANAVNAEVSRIIDINDAISDLIISEQVYQVVQGNFERASGNAAAFSKGSYPPETDIMNTPRSGITLTNRMVIQFDGEASSLVSPNAVSLMTAKAIAEPSVNKWLSENLPLPAKVICKVTYSSPVSPETEIPVSQLQLGLQSIDLLHLFNLETEQAMTELDDRISHYVRYSVSMHPKTDITINYTSSIDDADKTKVSFFELAALIKSLHKLLIGSKYLLPSQLTVPKDDGTQRTGFEDEQLERRVIKLRGGLSPLRLSMGLTLDANDSIKSLSEGFRADLEALHLDASKIELLVLQLGEDLKNYFIKPVAGNETRITDAFTSSIDFIPDAGTKSALIVTYRGLLHTYADNFSNFDILLRETETAFLNMAFFDNVQTGIGFISQGITGVYQTVSDKLDVILKRWDKKKSEVEAMMLIQYPLLTSDNDKIELLKKAERIISASFSTWSTESEFKSNIDTIKTAFDILLRDLRDLKTNARQNVTEFIVDAETALLSIGLYDVIPFDMEKETNDLGAEKNVLALLKEDIVIALNNMVESIDAKVAACNILLASAEATTGNTEKVNHLLNAAKAILGDEALLLPLFRVSEPQATEIENAFIGKDHLLDFVKANEERLLPVEDWMAGVARVRDKMHEWENTCFLVNAFSPDNLLDISPLQFPYRDNDRWLAMNFRNKEEEEEAKRNNMEYFIVESDTLLYTAHFAVGYDKTKLQCGIVLDEWTELVPADNETTGIAFHYDQPNSEPPQTMLLITPSTITGKWNWDDIIDAMDETLTMAKKRAVEPSQIETTEYAQLLPATITAVTRHMITISLNYIANNVSEIELNHI